MKLDYNILWIDNELQEYIDRGEVKYIEDTLIEKGFEPNIEKVFNEANLDEFIHKHDYDLIISDFNLENTTGDLVIQDIRVNKRLDTEILFYTARGDYKNKPEVLERLAFIERLTFWANREGLIEKIERVINLTLKKLLELNATRGLITSATSHLDVEIEDLVLKIIQRNGIKNEDLEGFVKSKVFDPLQKRTASFWEKYDNFSSFFPKIDAIKKWEILRDLLKPQNNVEAIGTFLQINKSYQVEVIDIRNKFAHARAVDKEGQQVLKGQVEGEDFEYTEESCFTIRQNLIRHKNNIEALKMFLE